MSFEPWYANNKTSREHMMEAITKNRDIKRYSKILVEKYDMTIDEIINECWRFIRENTQRKACAEHLSYYNGRMIETEIDNKFARQTTSSVVLWFVQDEGKKRRRQKKQFERFTMEMRLLAPLEDSEPKLNMENLLLLLERAEITEQEVPLIFWVLKAADNNTVEELLSVCHKTLYNRWYKLRDRLAETLNDPYKMVPSPKTDTISIAEVLKYLSVKNGTTIAETVAEIRAVNEMPE